MDDNRKTVSDRNFTVSLLENLKTFLARLFSDLVRTLKVVSWSVRVENQISIPEPIDTREELKEIVSAVKDIPIPKDIDLSPVVDAVTNIPRTEIPEFPTSLEITNQPDMEKVSASIVEAILAIPKAEQTDLSKLEKLLADKTVNVKEIKDVITILKLIFNKLNEEKEPIDDKPLSEKIEYYNDGTYKKSTTTYRDRIVTETRMPGDKEDTYVYEEENA
jgi:hypothetical protein